MSELAKVLIIDDDERLAEFAALLLASRGHEAHVAPSGEQGLEMLRREPFDLAIIDYVLPGASGLDVLRRLRETNSLPVVALTGDESQNVAVRFFLAGAQDFISKPFDPDFFQLVVDRALSRQRDKERMRRSELEKLSAERLAAERKRMIDMIAHHLRTPLSVVAGYMELLRNASEDANESRWNGVAAALNELRDIVSHALDAAEAEDLRVEPRSAWLSEMAKSVKARLPREGRARGTVVKYSVNEDAEIETDPLLLEDALVELMRNAMKFTETGEVVLRIEKRGDRARFEVEDTGAGMAAGDLERVFEPFVQLDRTGNTPGVGLGLHLARRKARALGGDITVESEEGKGSRFVLEIPAFV